MVISGSSPLSCGDLTETGILKLEAFIWAVQTFRSRHRNLLNGINVGAIAFDSCDTSSRVVQTAVNVDGCVVSYGTPSVDAKRIMAYIGPETNKVALDASPVLGSLQKTSMSYGATAVELR